MSEDTVWHSWHGDVYRRYDCVSTYHFGLGRSAQVITTYMRHYGPTGRLIDNRVDGVRHCFEGMDETQQAAFYRALESKDFAALEVLCGIFRPSPDTDPLLATYA